MQPDAKSGKNWYLIWVGLGEAKWIKWHPLQREPYCNCSDFLIYMKLISLVQQVLLRLCAIRDISRHLTLYILHVSLDKVGLQRCLENTWNCFSLALDYWACTSDLYCLCEPLGVTCNQGLGPHWYLPAGLSLFLFLELKLFEVIQILEISKTCYIALVKICIWYFFQVCAWQNDLIAPPKSFQNKSPNHSVHVDELNLIGTCIMSWV